ncbi:hypothetical protein [Microbacterium hominis]|uniref:hypothetical protein n=1 Tax=Microbacterium hominis TaxID=162426 RepID=UPI00076893C7|nr:hypothetical protein [Microbacterium hominis]KXC05762.1 hypothetical protein MhomT_09175 [Microbacterium hominis]
MTAVINARFAGGTILVESTTFTHTSTVDLSLPGSLPVPLRSHEAADLTVALAGHLPLADACAVLDRLTALVEARAQEARTIRRRRTVDERLIDLEG